MGIYDELEKDISTGNWYSLRNFAYMLAGFLGKNIAKANSFFDGYLLYCPDICKQRIGQEGTVHSIHSIR